MSDDCETVGATAGWLGDSPAQGGERKAEFFVFEHGVDELNHWAPILLQKMQALPQLADVASDQQSAGPTLRPPHT